jgi:hypothetical protein
MEGLYLIWCNNYIERNEKIYKVGRSDILYNRVKSYPSGSKILFTILCNESRKCEHLIINKFNYYFILKKGYEYFYGDADQMIMIIKNIVMLECNIIDITNIINVHQNFNNREYIQNYINNNPKQIGKKLVTYKCEKCEAEFNNKAHYNKHISRKTPCVTHYIKINDNLYKCRYCDAEYTRSTTVNSHIETCTEKIKTEKNRELNDLQLALEDKNKELKFAKFDLEDKSKELETTKKELEKLKKMYDALISNKSNNLNQTTNNTTDNSIDNSNTNITDNSTTDNSITNNDNSITNNTVNNIITIKFGDEDLSKLNFKEIKSILTSGYQAVPESFKLTNCNPRLPEQINAYIPNLRAPYAYVYDGEGYVLKDLNEVRRYYFE